MSTTVPIVILDSEPPDVRSSPNLHNVFFVAGSSLNIDDLIRAGVETASMAVVLTRASRQADMHAPNTVSIGRDIDAVFTVCVIAAKFGCRTLVELAENESMKFLPHRPQDDKVPAALWPQFCGGFVYSSSSLDTLLCQSFFNKSLLQVLSHIITPYLEADEDGLDDVVLSRGGAARKTLPHYIENKHVVQMRVPKPYIDREYRMLWMELMLTRGELPIALYRCSEAKSSPLPYVIANPRPSTRLHAADRVFVLCGQQLLAQAAQAVQMRRTSLSPRSVPPPPLPGMG